jgi:hypothetical protein
LKAGRKSIFATLNDFAIELHANGTADRWERQRKIAAVEKNLRNLNRKIREEKAMLSCLKA